MSTATYVFDLLPGDAQHFYQAACQTTPGSGILISADHRVDQVLLGQATATSSTTLEFTADLARAVAAELIAAANAIDTVRARKGGAA